MKGKKLPKARFVRKRGKGKLRGTKNQERSLRVEAFWEDVSEAVILDFAERAWRAALPYFGQGRPTLYFRFVFLVRGVEMFETGSPKLIRATHRTVKSWFLKSGVSYTVEGALFQLEKRWDDIEGEIADTLTANPLSQFYLRFVTAVAYVLAEDADGFARPARKG